ncbi:hypothetical protein CYMTET_26502 [Cymbomonas tetramitiformis]|uniref:Uncharacterized protein n=1 Tax=Cymbomonas tetramitiformis TaxID=36881 RepID=A0AAE0FS61_9CHLO|nr:hypothetical protein CYMTET_26502 [Cymbomonas tetramitiformis]
MLDRAHHWHRDCPRGGKRTNIGASMNSFTADNERHDNFALEFQHAIANDDDAEKFDALCVLAGGKLELISDISACSFCVDDDAYETTAGSEYTQYAQPVEAQMGFSVGGVGREHGIRMDAFAARVTAPSAAPPPPTEDPEAELDCDALESGSSIILSAASSPVHAAGGSHQPKFADLISGRDLSVRLATPAPLHLSYMQNAGADTRRQQCARRQ